ncbi:helix-turn-helix domain-containing protein [Variovorax paradoxus]|uniref:helix-turn-helix domain-containing protein n=1 Tax=Variovorax paradoxus TaxID=34073 RepID=UPI0029C6B846|nr:helix-turn-helix transcriptional regulator [Variovorax paradoxus]WPH20797.1 helix-turn-helix transcriptional regulator [Variovorax paradoxus]
MNATSESRPDEPAAGNADEPHVITPSQLALLVVLMRQARKWSQEQLAGVSGLTSRTIQRVERGEPSNVDTRRALARAFEAEDIDCFNKPYKQVTVAEMQAEQDKLERENITLAAQPATGKRLVELAESASADLFHAAVDLPQEAAEAFAALIDYWREYREVSELYSEVDKLDVRNEFQSRLDELRRMKFSLRLAERVVNLKVAGHSDTKPTRCRVGYVVAFPLGKEPDEIRAPRVVEFKF